MKVPSVRTAQRTTAIALLALSFFLLLALQMSSVLAQESSDDVWVLTETLVNPAGAKTEFIGGGADPTWFPEPRFEGKRDRWTITESAFRIDTRDVDHGYEYHNVSLLADFEPPPAVLVPGEKVELTVTGSYSGTVAEGRAGPGYQFWYTGEGIAVVPDSVLGFAPWNIYWDGRESATYTLDVPQTRSGVEIKVHAGLWNAEPAQVVWIYQAQQRPEGQGAEEGSGTGTGTETGTGTADRHRNRN